jgi:hypothetical protein
VNSPLIPMYLKRFLLRSTYVVPPPFHPSHGLESRTSMDNCLSAVIKDDFSPRGAGTDTRAIR